MSVSLNVRAYSSKENKEFQKHYNAVKFCVENELSYPKETSAFFKGKVQDCDDLENYNKGCILELIKNGVELDLPLQKDGYRSVQIKVSEIPPEADLIIVELC